MTKDTNHQNGEAEQAPLPKISELVQRRPVREKEADIEGFIKEIKNTTDLPADISAALKAAHSNIRMEIPDPPPDLWDTERSTLAEAYARQPSPDTTLKEPSTTEGLADASLDAPQSPAQTVLEPEVGKAADAAALDIALFENLAPVAVPKLNTAEEASVDIQDADLAAVANEVQPTASIQGQEQASTATDSLPNTAEGQPADTAEVEAPTDSPVSAAKTEAENSPSQVDTAIMDETSPEAERSSQTDEAARTQPGESVPKEKNKFRPLSLLSGQKNLVDACATLIFMHAVLLLALEFAWQQLPGDFFGFNKNSFAGFMLATAALQVLTLLFPLFLVFNAYRLPSETVLGKTRIQRPMVLASLLLGLPSALFFNGINNIFTYLIISWNIPLPNYVLPTWSSPAGIPELLLTLLIAAAVPSILEELFFRGFLLKSLYAFGGQRAAIFISALAFALFHNNPLFFIGPFGVGILLGYLRKNTESVLPAILTHLSINCATFLLDPILPRFNAKMVLLFPSAGQANLTANIVATISSGIVLFFIYRFINSNLVRSRSYTGFTTGRRAAIYGRNQAHKEAVLSSPDRQYKVPPLHLHNYLRLYVACALWLISRFLLKL